MDRLAALRSISLARASLAAEIERLQHQVAGFDLAIATLSAPSDLGEKIDTAEPPAPESTEKPREASPVDIKVNTRPTCVHCDQPPIGRGLCRYHYDLARREDPTFTPGKPAGPKTCDECDGPVLAKGKCSPHYWKSKRAAAKSAAPVKRAAPRFCEHEPCGKPIPPDKRSTAKYCSPPCMIAAQNARYRASKATAAATSNEAAKSYIVSTADQSRPVSPEPPEPPRPAPIAPRSPSPWRGRPRKIKPGQALSRDDELALQERFLAERGGPTLLPGAMTPEAAAIPPLRYDRTIGKFTRPTEADQQQGD